MRASVRIEASAPSTGSNCWKPSIGVLALHAASSSRPSMTGARSARDAIASACAGAAAGAIAPDSVPAVACAASGARGRSAEHAPGPTTRRAFHASEYAKFLALATVRRGWDERMTTTCQWGVSAW
jgi:hypothetical protein